VNSGNRAEFYQTVLSNMAELWIVKNILLPQKPYFFIIMEIIASAIISGISPYFLGKLVDAVTLSSRTLFVRMIAVYMGLLCLITLA